MSASRCAQESAPSWCISVVAQRWQSRIDKIQAKTIFPFPANSSSRSIAQHHPLARHSTHTTQAAATSSGVQLEDSDQLERGQAERDGISSFGDGGLESLARPKPNPACSSLHLSTHHTGQRPSTNPSRRCPRALVAAWNALASPTTAPEPCWRRPRGRKPDRRAEPIFLQRLWGTAHKSKSPAATCLLLRMIGMG
jgi:hypothetical protein